MTRSQRLKPVQQINQTQEAKALESLAEVQHRLRQASEQYHQLQQYQLEYSQKFDNVAQMRVQQLQEFQQFYAQLGQALQGQQELIAQLQKEHDYKRGQWLKCRQRSNSMDKVVERYRDQERYQRDRSEQLEMDELSQRRQRKAY